MIGSSLRYEFTRVEVGPVLMRLLEVATFNNAEERPVNIQRLIGRCPILAAGNSDGNLAMFQYTGAGKRNITSWLALAWMAPGTYTTASVKWYRLKVEIAQLSLGNLGCGDHTEA